MSRRAHPEDGHLVAPGIGVIGQHGNGDGHVLTRPRRIINRNGPIRSERAAEGQNTHDHGPSRGRSERVEQGDLVSPTHGSDVEPTAPAGQLLLWHHASVIAPVVIGRRSVGELRRARDVRQTAERLPVHQVARGEHD